jgi:7-carboxy-7-deazaguanine synthase
MVNNNGRRNAPAWRELGRQRGGSRLQHMDKIIHYLVGHVFVKYSFIAKGLQIDFQAFEFNTKLLRNIFKRQCSEVRLPCLGADGRELRTNNFDDVVPLRKLIGERLQQVAKRLTHVYNYELKIQEFLAERLFYRSCISPTYLICHNQPAVMRISEIFRSLQGEGLLTGTPSIFVRTSGCNLRCDFCDTPYASWNPEGKTLSVEEIVRQVIAAAKMDTPHVEHVVLTGGEPMLARKIVALGQRLQEEGFHITVETAGTIYRDLPCDLMSISPKFANSTPSSDRAGQWQEKHEASRFRPQIVRQLMEQYPFQLKFVVDEPKDLNEILDFLSATCSHWQEQSELNQRILLMPQGIDLGTLQAKERWLKPLCEEHGFRFCSRRHIEWFGNRRGT